MSAPPLAPRRIAVYGPTGSGKTSAGAEAARRMGLPHLDLDTLHWRPGWLPQERTAFRAAVEAWLDARPAGWVCTGNYASIVGDIVMARAGAIVWLRLPLPLVFWRLLLRTMRRSLSGDLLWGTNRETLRKAVSRDSILLWCLTHWRAHARNVQTAIDTHGGRAQVTTLRRPRHVRAWLRALPPQSPSPWRGIRVAGSAESVLD